MTIALPFSAGWFWIGVITLSVLALSWFAFHIGGKEVDKDRAYTQHSRTHWQIVALRGYAGVLTPIWAALLILTIWSLFGLWSEGPPEASSWYGLFAKPDLVAGRLHYLALVGLMTALGGLVGLPLAVLRILTTERQVTANETGLITDRINKAVEGLGTEKTVKRANDDGETEEFTEANIEVRIGAIYSLERIAQDSDRHHDQETIVKILAAYIVNGTSETIEIRDSHRNLRSDLRIAIQSLAECRGVLKKNAASTTLKPDLRYAKFRNALLVELNFRNCRLNKANFYNSDCGFSNFTLCTLRVNDFENAFFSRCDFNEALVAGATMNEGTSFINSSFDKAGFHKLDFTGVTISQDQIDAAFGDATVILGHLKRPAHWSDEEMSFDDFVFQWQLWIERN